MADFNPPNLPRLDETPMREFPELGEGKLLS